MIKAETIGMLDVAKINPVLKATKAVDNYSFLTDKGVVYLICNTLTGDDAYVDKHTFAAGEYLMGYVVDVWKDQKLVIDDEHIAYGSSQSYATIVAGTTMLVVDEDTGKLKIADSKPGSGLYFLVTDKTTLVGKAVKAMVCIAG